MSSPEVRDAVGLAAALERLAERPEAGPDAEAAQRILAAAVKLYAARAATGARVGPFPADPPELEVTPTEGLVAASAILDALNIEAFELALWRSWGTSGG